VPVPIGMYILPTLTFDDWRKTKKDTSFRILLTYMVSGETERFGQQKVFCHHRYYSKTVFLLSCRLPFFSLLPMEMRAGEQLARHQVIIGVYTKIYEKYE
jgi:hypothetical protein